MMMQEMGERIRDRREQLGLTQRDVASALQVSNQAVSKWERGENAPDIEVLAGLGRLLGVSVDWLLGTYGREGNVFEATVLMTNIKGFTRRFGGMSERDGVAWLNGLLSQMTEAVLRHDGVPVKYLGDSLLAFFAGAAHRDRALRAALLAREVMGPSLTVGVHTGPIYLGRIGHAEYASRDIVGPTVNLLVRTAQWSTATSSGVAATGAVVDGLVDQDLVAAAGEAQAVELRGIDGPTAMHEVRLAVPAGS